MGLADRFRGSVYSHHGGKLSSVQADTVVEKEPIKLHLNLKAVRRRLTPSGS